MEWLWDDPERGEPTRWWTIDPRTGQPDGDVMSDGRDRHCLGESALDAVSEAADAIATIFNTKCFADEEVASLVLRRVVPASFRGGPHDAAELLELVDGLWAGAEGCYRQALRRQPDPVERRWLYDFAFATLRAREA